ncbi:MAG: hypothetical protein ACOX2X_08845 [Peptococcia bacterium]|jgi:hypothetical protein
MQIPKIIYYLLLSLVVLILMFDTYLYFSSVSNFRDALGQALDAAIVAGVDEPESQHGQMTVNYEAAHTAAEACLKKNLKLDGNLSNQFYADSAFTMEVRTRSGSGSSGDTLSSNIIEGKFTTHIRLLCLKMLGLGALPYSISKTQDFLSSYI